jgi:hypothetical protein
MALPCSRDRNVKHNIDYKKQWANVGDLVAIYPYSGEPFIDEVKKVVKNKYGRISYIVQGWGKQVMAEELFPGPLQDKLKIPYRKKRK